MSKEFSDAEEKKKRKRKDRYNWDDELQDITNAKGGNDVYLYGQHGQYNIYKKGIMDAGLSEQNAREGYLQKLEGQHLSKRSVELIKKRLNDKHPDWHTYTPIEISYHFSVDGVSKGNPLGRLCKDFFDIVLPKYRLDGTKITIEDLKNYILENGTMAEYKIMMDIYDLFKKKVDLKL